MPQNRSAGYISLNGTPYLVDKDPKSGVFSYNRASTPKKAVQATRRNASTGQSNLIEVLFKYSDGFGDATVNDSRDTYHYALNLYTEREGELVVLPGLLRLDPETNVSAVLGDINLPW